MNVMNVIKRNGSFEEVSFDKVLNRIKKLCFETPILSHVNYFDIAQKVCARIYNNVKTTELDELAAQICSSMILEHPEYGTLGARLIISNHQKNTSPSFSETVMLLYNNDGETPVLSDDFYKVVMANKEKLNNYIDYSRDYLVDYFGFKTLERAYLLKVNNKVIERPQHLFMRVAIGIHGNDIKDALETYDLMSKKYFTHATPTLFNAGTKRQQLSSCFLQSINGDSIDGIFDSIKESAMISKHAGGIGIHVHDVRSKGSLIRGTNGKSDGIIPMLKVFNQTARYVNQAGKRAGSIAVYLEPWHADIVEFLQLKRPHGNEEERARDLFYALWIPDLFMKRVKENGKWSLMCPDECKGLSDVYSEKFEELYITYEQQGKYRKQIDAQELWFKILECQIESGVPYLLYKDACNEKSNQKNLGTIKSSNLCTEIVEYSSPEETAVCNLASICLPSFVEKDENNKLFYNFEKLHEVTKVITKNLNKVIDINFYPIEKARKSNSKHRPIGMGVQGLADTYVLMKYPFDSEEARLLNEQIFETIYHAAIERSMELAEKMGSYESFAGSPASNGQLQFDLWDKEPSDRYEWNELKEKVKQVGLRNSLMIAPMPTASTSQIMGFNECFEPFTSNLYKRKTMAGEFILVNKYLINDLIELNLWNKDLKDKIMLSDGSVQNIKEIPDNIKSLYKTVWEIKQKVLIDQAADRGKYICQSQSMNLFVEDPDFKKLSSMHFYSWSSGLKTGIYYLRSKPKAKQQKFTVDPNLQKFANVNKKEESKEENKEIVCTDEVCVVCSS